MRRWFVNARFRRRRMTGVDRYAHELASRLPGAREVLPPPACAHGVRAHLWDQTALLAATQRGWLWSPCGTGPVLHPRHVITIHDVGPLELPDGYAPGFVRTYRVLFPLLARRARLVLTVSEDARQRIARTCAIDAQRIAVVPNGVDPRFTPGAADAAVLAGHGLTAGGYVLSVGSITPRKNLGRLLAAWRQMPRPPGLVLALAGGTDRAVHGADPLAAEAGVQPLGSVPDAHLPDLYRGAAAFVLPSLYEGFGIPALEAMACGCPVAASHATALPEVCGDAARLFDPLDPAAIAAALLATLGDTTLRQRGLARAAAFTWEAAAARLVQVLEAC